MHRILKQAIATAVRWRMLQRNPLDDVDPPKVERRKMAALDAAETAQLLAHFRDSRMFIPVLLAVMCGLRRGEITALRWGSVDLAPEATFRRRKHRADDEGRPVERDQERSGSHRRPPRPWSPTNCDAPASRRPRSF